MCVYVCVWEYDDPSVAPPDVIGNKDRNWIPFTFVSEI